VGVEGHQPGVDDRIAGQGQVFIDPEGLASLRVDRDAHDDLGEGVEAQTHQRRATVRGEVLLEVERSRIREALLANPVAAGRRLEGLQQVAHLSIGDIVDRSEAVVGRQGDQRRVAPGEVQVRRPLDALEGEVQDLHTVRSGVQAKGHGDLGAVGRDRVDRGTHAQGMLSEDSSRLGGEAQQSDVLGAGRVDLSDVDAARVGRQGVGVHAVAPDSRGPLKSAGLKVAGFDQAADSPVGGRVDDAGAEDRHRCLPSVRVIGSGQGGGQRGRELSLPEDRAVLGAQDGQIVGGDLLVGDTLTPNREGLLVFGKADHVVLGLRASWEFHGEPLLTGRDFDDCNTELALLPAHDGCAQLAGRAATAGIKKLVDQAVEREELERIGAREVRGPVGQGNARKEERGLLQGQGDLDQGPRGAAGVHAELLPMQGPGASGVRHVRCEDRAVGVSHSLTDLDVLVQGEVPGEGAQVIRVVHLDEVRPAGVAGERALGALIGVHPLDLPAARVESQEASRRGLGGGVHQPAPRVPRQDRAAVGLEGDAGLLPFRRLGNGGPPEQLLGGAVDMQDLGEGGAPERQCIALAVRGGGHVHRERILLGDRIVELPRAIVQVHGVQPDVEGHTANRAHPEAHEEQVLIRGEIPGPDVGPFEGRLERGFPVHRTGRRVDRGDAWS
jgi:hypothetical protein